MTFLCGARRMRARHGRAGIAIRLGAPGLDGEATPATQGNPRGTRPEFTRSYPFCPSFAQGVGAARFRPGWAIAIRRGFGVGVSKRGGLIRLPTLRFRAKIMLGFAVTLAISAASMGFAYLGFEHVSTGVASFRKSVTEADLARNIDRELISYRSLARYYVVTGKEEDSKAALVAEAALKDAIDQSMKGSADPARLEQVTKLAREFRAFTKIFAEIVKVKEESEYLTKNALTRSEMSLEYKFDDLASTAKEAELPAVEFQAKNITGQFQSIKITSNNFVATGNQSSGTSTLSRLSFLDNGLKNIPTADEKIGAVVKEIGALLTTYRDALAKLIANRKMIDGLITEMGESAEEIIKGAGVMKAALVSEQARLEIRIERIDRRYRASDPDAGGRRTPARSGLGIPAG